MNLFILWNTRR